MAESTSPASRLPTTATSRRPKAVLEAGVHLLIEKPSVLKLQELDELVKLAEEHAAPGEGGVPQAARPRPQEDAARLCVDGVLQHVNNGYCSLLEPKSDQRGQFAEWITGRNPGTYVAVHYIKLIDFTFGGRLKTVTGDRSAGIVGPADGPTWDSMQMRLVYEFDDGPRGGVRHSYLVGHPR